MTALIIPLAAVAALAVGYRLGRGARKDIYRQGRWDGLEEGYRNAMEDGWTGVRLDGGEQP